MLHKETNGLKVRHIVESDVPGFINTFSCGYFAAIFFILLLNETNAYDLRTQGLLVTPQIGMQF